MRKRFGIMRFVAGVAGAATIAGGAFALTASNTVPTSSAGAGQATISGYTVTNVHYNLNSTNPQNIDSVTFTLDTAPPAGSTVRVKLVAAGSTYYSCTNATVNVTCTTTTPAVSVSAADQLLVVAAQ
jgi:hypothetical protein